MSFKKPFRAQPVKLGEHYQKKRQAKHRVSTARLFIAAIVTGGVVGTASSYLPRNAVQSLFAPRSAKVEAQDVEAAPSASNVYYRFCSDARAAGVAPIHSGEPGYRSGLDADGDGVACEPYRGN